MENKLIKTIFIAAAGIAINLAGGIFARSLDLPIWFDMVGTMIAVYYSGIWGGAIAGIGGNIALSIINGENVVYALTSLAAAVMLSVFIKRGYMETVLKAMVSSFWLGIVCVFISTPISYFLCGGYCGNVWGDALADMLIWYNAPRFISTLAGQAAVDIIDKQFCVLIACIVIKIIGHIKNRKDRKNSSASASKALAVTAALGLIIPAAIKPIEAEASVNYLFSDNFVETIYDNKNGLVSSEANTICETDDGHIWIGSYAGLTRFNGKDFEFIRESGLVSVMCMMQDSSGRLWIGTNDAGIAIYEKGEFRYIKTDNGLSSDSVRCFAEDKNKNIYIGTTSKLCKYDAHGEITVMPCDVAFIRSMAAIDDVIALVDNTGKFYTIDDGNLLTPGDSGAEYFYNCISATSYGFAAGTATGEILVFDTNDGDLRPDKVIRTGTNGITSIKEDSRGYIWAGSDDGYGYIGKNDKFYKLATAGFDSSIDSIIEDYQGNIWLTSSRYGVAKLTESKFINVFEQVNSESSIVNAVVSRNGSYYCGTDKGLVVIDGFTMQHKSTGALAEYTGSSRIRSIFVDSCGRMWISTYGENGLICYEENGSVFIYNTSNGATSDRFRCTTELSDGTIAAGTADGINLIDPVSRKITKTLTAESGLQNTQILSVTEGPDGNLWAGTDGSGIYIIRNGIIVNNLTTADELSSNVIMRIVPHNDGALIVASNGLCHINNSNSITKLTNFPYFNNYDIILKGENAYVTCSAGIYRLNADALCKNEIKQLRLYGANDGLSDGLIANSWNYVSDNGDIYLCTNNGVMVFSEKKLDRTETFKFGVTAVEYGDNSEIISENAYYNVPRSTRNIAVYASVRNYALSDAKVRFFAEETDQNPKIYDWDKIEPIQINDLNQTVHTIHLQMLDSTGENVLQEKLYTIIRESQLWERPAFIGYLIIVCAEILIFIVLSIGSMVLFSKRKNELEKLRVELAEKVKEQTEALEIEQHKTEDLFLQTISALSGAVDAKDRYTSGHSTRVAEYARMLAARMGKSEEEQEEIYRAGLLHDVGKIRVPGEIINKAGKLTDEEFDLIKIHPVTGYHILKDISGSKLIALGAKFHHERYDGRGYPNGLAGENIPEVARILGVADSYDAMASNRSYRSALPQEVVRSEIEKGRGTQFDPAIADLMLQVIDEDKNYDMKQTNSLKKTILVVDDESIYTKMISHIMSDEPMHEIISAASGAEALEKLEEMKIDLVLLDMKMPEMDGLEVLSRIREKYTVPVVFMTGDKNIETIEKATEMGSGDYITKPFQPLLLKEVIHSMSK